MLTFCIIWDASGFFTQRFWNRNPHLICQRCSGHAITHFESLRVMPGMRPTDQWPSKDVTKRINGPAFFYRTWWGSAHFLLGKKTFHDVIGKAYWHSKFNSANWICSVLSFNILVAFLLGTVTHELLNEHYNCEVHGLYTGCNNKNKTKIASFREFSSFFLYFFDVLGFFIGLFSKFWILRFFIFLFLLAF